MTEEQARKLLETIMLATQRVRSETAEAGIDENILGMLYPWIAGERNILVGLEKILAKEKVEPIDLYNMLTIIHRTDPIRVWCEVHNIILPQPDSAWLMGFALPD